MKTTRTIPRALVALVAVGLVVAACGDDDEADTTVPPVDDTASPTVPGTAALTAPPTAAATSTMPDTGSTTPGTGSVPSATVDLVAAGCPDPLVIQTDWFPESEHGGLYEMVGEGYEVDTDAKIVSGPLVAGGEETGIDLEIRTGGPAIGYQPVSVRQYADDDIHLGYANTSGQVLRWSKTPTISVVAPLEIDPQIIYWDPETYPEVETLADLGESGATINILEGATFAEVFVGQGIWQEDQIDGSYDGSPGRFIAAGGALAQQGFASAEPYTYENVFEDWGKPVRYQLLHDAGFEVYSQTLSVKPDELEELRPCLEAFVPIVQQAQVDFVNAPDRANAIIIDAVDRYGDSWQYDEALAEYSVATQKELGLVGNGPDDTLGNMDEDRIQRVIDQIRDDAGLNVPDDLVAADLFTNEFIDPDIGL
ncbi:MAG: ABC transporter substrate-binding protein [Acidimicrobiia bacterium]|nr:ABC transporter substrate-binding protein [Acidimicrobiia bacterium]